MSKKRAHVDIQYESTNDPWEHQKRLKEVAERKKKEEEILLTIGDKYKRPELPQDYHEKDIIIQVVDVDYDNQYADDIKTSKINKEFIPIITIYGIDEESHSIAINIPDFSPYFFLKPLYPAFLNPDDWINDLQQHFENHCKLLRKQKNCPFLQHKKYILKIEQVWSKSIDGWVSDDDEQFFKVTVVEPAIIPKLRNLTSSGFNLSGNRYVKFDTFESNILYVTRFNADHDVYAGAWIKAPVGKYNIAGVFDRYTNSQTEVFISHEDLISLGCEGEWKKNAPLRVLSFDEEWAGRRGIFPEPKLDPIITIAFHLSNMFGKEERNIVLAQRGCLPITGCDVYSFYREANLILAFQIILEAYDPDVITGWNIDGFDIPWLFGRAEVLIDQSQKVKCLSRKRGYRCAFNERLFGSSQVQKRAAKELYCPGRVIMDMLRVVTKDFKERSYTLNSISAKFLGDQKEDVHHSQITPLYEKGDEERKRIATYCLKDAILPIKIMRKIQCLFNYTEMARVTGINSLKALLFSGQSVKVMTMLCKKAKKRGFLIPFYAVQEIVDSKEEEELNDKLNRRQFDQKKPKNQVPADDEVGYEGATVIEPIRGFYETVLATLDFASLCKYFICLYHHHHCMEQEH